MFKLSRFLRQWPKVAAVSALGLLLQTPAHAEEPIKIGLVAALSGQSAKSGGSPDPRTERCHRRTQRGGRHSRQTGGADSPRR